MEFDLYADENEPVVKYISTTYLVRHPQPASIRKEDAPFIYVEVDAYGQASIGDRTVWSGDAINRIDSHSRNMWDLKREIIDYLVEWELLQWKRIGPEDSEIFATEKLVGDKEYERFGL